MLVTTTLMVITISKVNSKNNAETQLRNTNSISSNGSNSGDSSKSGDDGGCSDSRTAVNDATIREINSGN